MSTACGRPQGGEGLAHVDRGRVKNPIFFGHQKWMVPNPTLFIRPAKTVPYTKLGT